MHEIIKNTIILYPILSEKYKIFFIFHEKLHENTPRQRGWEEYEIDRRICGSEEVFILLLYHCAKVDRNALWD